MPQKTYRLILVLFFILILKVDFVIAQNPLSAFSPIWNEAKYKKANTGATVKYLSTKEKQILFVLNLVRMNPPLFASTAVKKFPARMGRTDLVKLPEYLSLLDTLNKLKPLPLLYPDSLCWVSARCHAASSGEIGYVGHERVSDKCSAVSRFSGECCHYGYSDPFDIVMSLLIDEGVPSLGHRKILLLKGFTRLGVAIAPHSEYGTNTVLDFD